MLDKAQPAAALAAEAAPAAPKPPGPPAKKDSFKFDLIANGKFSIDTVLTTGTLEATLKFNPELQATYRTMSASEIQACEEIVDDAMRKERSAKFVMNELTICQLYYSLVSLNGKAIPAAGKKPYTVRDPVEPNPRREWIRNLAGPLFDLVTLGLNEFDKRAKTVVTKESVANF